MSNSYFQFKQFTIYQDKTAMKVCTDSCLFGSIIATKYPAANVLDIGTGTGLLSLMYAQKNTNSTITAIDIEENAVLQSKENVSASPWKENITIKNTPLQQFQAQLPFDLILSNPPFFHNDLKSAKDDRNTAMHATQLSLSEIFEFAQQYSTDDTILALLIPFHRTAETEKIATQYGFFIAEKISVKQTSRHPFFRSILFFNKKITNVAHVEIVIKDNNNQYTELFSDFLKDYYLTEMKRSKE